LLSTRSAAQSSNLVATNPAAVRLGTKWQFLLPMLFTTNNSNNYDTLGSRNMAKSYTILHDKVISRPGAPKKLADLRSETLAQIALHELRRSEEVSQVVLAERLEITQPAVSKIERASDLRIITLRKYVEALGATLNIEAVFSDGRRLPLTIGEK
jgi:DNA-binding transcriptional regulator YiaG